MPYQIAAYDAETDERIDVYSGEWYQSAEAIDGEEVDRAYQELMALSHAVQSTNTVRMHVEKVEVIDHPAARLGDLSEHFQSTYVRVEES